METVGHKLRPKRMQILVAFCIGNTFSGLTRYGSEQIHRHVEEPENLIRSNFSARKQEWEARFEYLAVQKPHYSIAVSSLICRVWFCKEDFYEKKSEIMKREKRNKNYFLLIHNHETVDREQKKERKEEVKVRIEAKTNHSTLCPSSAD